MLDKLIPSVIGGLFAGFFWIGMVTPRVEVRGSTLKVLNPFFVWEVPLTEITDFRKTVGLQISIRAGREISVAACPQSPWAMMSGNRYARRVADRLDHWQVDASLRFGAVYGEGTQTVLRKIRWTALASVLGVCAMVVVLGLIGLLMAT